MVGYAVGTKAWRFWDPAARCVIISKDVIFDESCQPLIHGTAAKQTPPQRLVDIPDDIAVPQHAPVPPFMPVMYCDPPDVSTNPPGTPSAPPGLPSQPDSHLPPSPALPPPHPPPSALPLVNAP